MQLTWLNETFSFGEKILFLPLLIILCLIALGFILFLVVNISLFVIHIPALLVKKSHEAHDSKLLPPKKKSLREVISLQEIWLYFKSGSWIGWLASLPLLLLLLLFLLYFIELTLPLIF